ncbi:apolipoprotein N-acyltransferase [Nocardioides panacisoli]|uniref:Apolipoprotein N-acyltransferase n=1 Tax=Nocardioides panacisoli TaxID=627624 RepID=A0ABP7IQA0_9ACTN
MPRPADYARVVPGRLLLAVAGGLLLTTAFEPIAIPYVVPFGVAAFALATRDLTVRRSGLVGLVFGVAFYFVHIEWMRRSVGPDAWLALSATVALFYGVLGLAVPLLRRLPAWPVWLAAAWTAMEQIHSTWPLSGMPWGRLSFAAVDTPAAQAAPYLSLTGVSFVLALTGFLLAAAVERWRRPLVPVAGLVAVLALLMIPAVHPYHVHETGSAVVAAVQGDLPGPANQILWDYRAVTDNHVAATEQLAQDVANGTEPAPDFVLWPENSTAIDPFADASINSGIRSAVAAIGVPVVVGAIVDDGPSHVLNQGIVWDPHSGAGDRYTKRHPVPYGEYIPFRNLWDPDFGQLSAIARDMDSGTRTSPLTVAGIKVADAICFDIAYDDVVRSQVAQGAELLTVQTSNATFIYTNQVAQQFAITRLRAMEAGRWLVVASPNGRSGVIAPDGTVVASAPLRTEAVLDERVGLVSQLTPATRMGAWPGRLFTGASALGLALGALAYRRSRDHSGSTGAAEDAPELSEARTP